MAWRNVWSLCPRSMARYTLAMAAETDPVFACLVRPGAAGRARRRDLVALGLYGIARGEWLAGRTEGPTEADLAAYAETWTPSRLDGLREQADLILDADAREWAEAHREVVGAKMFRNWLGGTLAALVLAGVLGTVAVFGLKLLGVDVIGAVERACLPPAPPRYVGERR